MNNISYLLILSKFFVVLAFVSVAVLWWSKFYMNKDWLFTSFIVFTLLFITSMGLLLVSETLWLVFIGWEGLGLTSYFLVMHFRSLECHNNSMNMFLTMRMGDSFFLMSLLLPILPLVLIIGATKSATFPFMTWLPKAMSAPTPISALVHSSTLVTAGIFLWSKSSVNLSLLFYLLSLTILFAGFLAYREKDTKRVVAYSTLSQITLMVWLISSGYISLALFHLMVHAFFKSLLFIGVGEFLHSSSSEQSVVSSSSLSSSMVLMATLLGLMGAPYLSGMISKDLMMTTQMELLFYLSMGLTFLYSLNLITGTLSSSVYSLSHLSAPSFISMSILTLPVLVLGMLSALMEPAVTWEKSSAIIYLLLFILLVPFLRTLPCSTYWTSVVPMEGILWSSLSIFSLTLLFY